jgi:hypothetical protein
MNIKATLLLALALLAMGCPDRGPSAPKSPGGTTTGGGW